MSDPKDALRAYIALARGPGGIKAAAEGTFDADLPDDVELEPDAISTELPAVDSVPPGTVDVTDAAELDLPPSPMFVRVLEELSAYVAPAPARKALAESLAMAGVHPDEATSLDLREAVVDVLPRLLGPMFRREDLDLVLERLERALTDAILPRRVR